ncbi:MAG: glucosaminidase domain-containing protein [Bacteroidaceae bacterium]|jgi:LysM repeat protein|nr:glucosaminidase domain-containing protein [Bacteroidaceae bacterium]
MRRLFLTLFLVALALSAAAQNQQYVKYIDQHKALAVDQMKKYNIPASITLAQALLESGAGQSELARKSNNHFGIKCHDWAGRKVYHDDDMRDDCFRVYKSVKDSYEDHSIFLSSHQRYAGLFRLKPTDYVGWARGLKAAGYATSPTYADRLINIIESYNLDRLDSDKWKYAPTYFPEAPHTPHLANGLVYVVARQGDTMQGIADEFKISRSKLIRYNDLYKTYVPQKGDIIYLHRKNARAQKGYAVHIVKDGDSMYLISQMYGIRLARLYKMNKDKGDIYTYSPRINDIIRLR